MAIIYNLLSLFYQVISLQFTYYSRIIIKLNNLIHFMSHHFHAMGTLLLRTIQRLNDELTPKKEQELLLFPPSCLTFFSIEKNRIWQNSTTKLFFFFVTNYIAPFSPYSKCIIQTKLASSRNVLQKKSILKRLIQRISSFCFKKLL